MPDRVVATRYFQYKTTIPPGTTDPTNPQRDTVAIPHGTLLTVLLQVPSGHVGLTGFSLWLAGTQIVPWEGELDYIVAEDQTFVFDVNVEVDVQLETVCYNADIWDHSFYWRAALRYIDNPGAGAPAVPGSVFAAPIAVNGTRITP